jgi:glycerate dehydrogenase
MEVYMKIVIFDGHTVNPGDLNWNALESICETEVYDATEPEQFAERLGDAEILILEDPFLDVQGREAEQLASLLEEMLDGRTAIICAQSAKYLRKCCDTLCRATSSSLTFEEETEIEEEAEQ